MFYRHLQNYVVHTDHLQLKKAFKNITSIKNYKRLKRGKFEQLVRLCAQIICLINVVH